jgi:predicted lysophospholipase L1 biosynthesis ABC-type transport system permease subunit
VAIVNETLAARLWPNQDPIGRRFTVADASVWPEGKADVMWQVVGVARDSKYLAVFEAPLPHFYLPIAQVPSFLRSLQIRSALPPELLGARLRDQVAQLDPDMPIADIRPLTEGLAGNIGFLLFRVGAMQAASLGGLGLVLAVIGVYGVVSYRAAQRAREIGIRLALGATPSQVVAPIIRHGMALAIAGVALGLVASLVATRLVAAFLFGVEPTDPLTFAAVSALLLTVSLLASYIPSRRALKVDAITALRAE